MNSVAENLIASDLLSQSDAERAEQICNQSNSRYSAVLCQLGMVSDDDLAQFFAREKNLAIISSEELPAEMPVIAGLNLSYLQKHSILPIAINDDMLDLAMADPEDDEVIAAMAFASEREIRPSVARYSDIEDYARDENSVLENSEELLGSETLTGDDLERIMDGSSEAPVIRFVQTLLANAVKKRASDVHIEPMARYLSVRYRIDGRLGEVERQPAALAERVASRIKVMADLDISESRLPQDGRLKLTVRGQDVDVRVSTSPIANGESIVLRLLGRSELPLDIEKLGLPEVALKKFLSALDRPHGIILLTGPTGSGKTTTLYSALTRLQSPDVKILTVEDPVEVLLEGVNQVQVRPDIDLDYATTLRAFLRQDPDILMIGEIRDRETADIALRAALTGHLVLSTLHTNSATGAFTRLGDIGIEPYLAASTVIAAVAQRLVRTLCSDCKTRRPILDSEKRLFEACNMEAPTQVYEPSSCKKCQQSGYLGRMPLIEIVTVDEELRELVLGGNAEQYLAQKQETLQGHGLALIAEGRTSFTEINRAVNLI